MNDRRLRAHLAELELTAALLLYANTVDVDGDGDGDDPPSSPPPAEPSPPGSNVIPLRRPSPPQKK